jgi:Methyltransferase domain
MRTSQLADCIAREQELLPPAVMEVPSMLSYEERALLHWAAREGRGADGQVIDAGSYLGGSTLSLAHGLRASGNARGRRVHAYDRFRVDADWERVYFPDDFEFAVGASTVGLYLRHIDPVAELVQTYLGDIHGFRWNGDPIATLFVDVAKSWDTHDHVVREFFPSLAPGALVVQQDQVHFGHPWCAISMELLEGHAEYIGWAHYSSAVYHVPHPIPPDALPLGLLERLSLDEALALVERFADRVGEPQAGQVRLSAAVVLGAYGQFERAREHVREVDRSYDDASVPYISDGFAHLTQWIDALEAQAQPG